MCELLDFSMIWQGNIFFVDGTSIEILTDRYLDPNGYDVANVLITDEQGSRKSCLELIQIIGMIE